MVRPQPTRRRFARRTIFALALAGAAALAAGCADPNLIGVQDYGSVQGNVVDGSGKPVNDAIVSIGAEVVHTVPNGSFTLDHVPVGEQTIAVSAGGYGPASGDSLTVIVKKNTTVSAGNIAIMSTGNTT